MREGWPTRLTIDERLTMSTKTAPKPAQVNDSNADLTGAAKEIAATTEQKVAAEVNLIATTGTAHIRALAETGPLGLVELAKSVGRSVSSSVGRPTLLPWLTFVTACALQKVTHKQFDNLCRVALAEVGTSPDAKMNESELAKAKEKFIKSKAKGSVGGSSASLKMNTPAAWDITIGE